MIAAAAIAIAIAIAAKAPPIATAREADAEGAAVAHLSFEREDHPATAAVGVVVGARGREEIGRETEDPLTKVKDAPVEVAPLGETPTADRKRGTKRLAATEGGGVLGQKTTGRKPASSTA
jgi:hypothetical protein